MAEFFVNFITSNSPFRSFTSGGWPRRQRRPLETHKTFRANAPINKCSWKRRERSYSMILPIILCSIRAWWNFDLRIKVVLKSRYLINIRLVKFAGRSVWISSSEFSLFVRFGYFIFSFRAFDTKRFQHTLCCGL